MKTIPVSILIPYKNHDSLDIWMQTRESNDELAGLLEFPGGKVEQGETPAQACSREVLEEVGVKIDPTKLQLSTIHNNNLGEKIISLYVFIYEDQGEFKESWYNSAKKEEYFERIPPANKFFLEQVLSSIKTIS